MYKDNEMNEIKKFHQDQLKGTIGDINQKLDRAKYNMEAAEEIIAESSCNTAQKKLTEKNLSRKQGISDFESRH